MTKEEGTVRYDWDDLDESAERESVAIRRINQYSRRSDASGNAGKTPVLGVGCSSYQLKSTRIKSGSQKKPSSGRPRMNIERLKKQNRIKRFN